MSFGFLLGLLPGLISNSWELIRKISLDLNHGTNPLLSSSEGYSVSLLRSALAFIANRWWGDHYVHGPLIDPLTGALFLLGLGFLFSRASSWRSVILIIWLFAGFLAIVMLSSSPVPVPYVTRLIYLLPPLCLSAGYALSSITSVLKTPWVRTATITLSITICALLNLQQLYLGTPLATPLYTERLAVRELQNTTSGTVIFISKGEQPDEIMRNLLKLFTPQNVSVIVTTEKEFDRSFSGQALAEFPAQAKLIAPVELSTQLKNWMRMAARPVALSTIHGIPHGDTLVTTDIIHPGSPFISASNVPRVIKNMLGLF